ncbi:MAG TPA: T9SS type A sorting domain-containing protein, partial [Acidimicrobiales bacterium]|nr:T9SS type A sorting domain-containing protein [Acidimicrobiales bacterium]
MSRRYAPAFLSALLLAPTLTAAQDSTFTQVPIGLPQGFEYESVAPADYDGDGDLDLLVIRGDGAFISEAYFPELYRNDGFDADSALALTLMPFPAPPIPGAPLGGDPYGETLSWADYDNDGDVDAFVAAHNGTALYRNDGGTFIDAGMEFPVYEEFLTWYFAEPNSSAWADYDNDGDLDLAAPGTFPGGPWPSPDTTRVYLYENQDSLLVRSGAVFPPTSRDVDLRWGDVENDGDLDLLYLSAGYTCDPDANPDVGECVVVYDNDGGTLTPRPLDFPQIEGGAADFGDFDLDGDLDVLLVASLVQETGPPYILERALVYRNDGATFAPPDTLEFPFSFDDTFQFLTAGQWADYDSDGDVDILIGADVNDYAGPGEDFGGVAFVFANDGGEFTLTADLPASERFGTNNWADLDGDGDLDLLATGRRVEVVDSSSVWVTFARLYRNDAPLANTAPAPPPALDVAVSGDQATFSWGAAYDDHTPAEALTYNLWVQTRSGSDIVSPLARPGGGRLVTAPGNVSLNRDWTLYGLPNGAYVWWVQAVDNAFNGGAFADGGTFTVGAPTGTEGGTAPAIFAVREAYPNPVSGGDVVVRVDLPVRAEVTVRLYDVLGRAVLASAPQAMEAGSGRAAVLGVSGLPAGVYVYRVEAA